MRHRIYTRDPLAGLVTISGEELHHAARVVRVREGEEVELFDGEGRAAAGIVQSIEREQMVVRIDKPIESRESPVAIDLAMSIIQLEKFELVLQKATELGVARLVPNRHKEATRESDLAEGASLRSAAGPGALTTSGHGRRPRGARPG